MPLKIEVGKKYRTRSGDVVEIIERRTRRICPFVGRFITRPGYVSTFTQTGQWIDGDDTEDDLMFEELPADAPE